MNLNNVMTCCNPFTLFFKASLSMLETRGQLLAKEQIELPSMMMRLIGDYDETWGVKKLLFYKYGPNTVHLHIKLRNVGLVDHA